MPTAFTLPLLFIISRHSLKLSPDGAFSPSTELKQIQDGIWMFSSSSSSTNACKLRRLTCMMLRNGKVFRAIEFYRSLIIKLEFEKLFLHS